MGTAAYVSRVAGLAVAIGLGAAVTSGTGIAYAGEGDPPRPPTDTADATETDPPETDEEEIDEDLDDDDELEEDVEEEIDGEEDLVEDLPDDEPTGDGPAVDAPVAEDPVDEIDENEDDPGNGDQQPPPDVQQPGNLTGAGDVDQLQDEQTDTGAVDLQQPPPATPNLAGTTQLSQAPASLLAANQPTAETTTLRTEHVATEAQAQQLRPAGIVSTFLAALGLSPQLNTPPIVPGQVPAVWALLAWVRRQFEQALFNDSPSIAYVPNSALPVGPRSVAGNLNVSDPDLDSDELDRLTYSTSGIDDGATLVINDDGTFVYTAPASWTGDTPYEDDFTVTVSDASTGPHLHGFLGFLRPQGGHTASQAITVTVPAADESDTTVVIEGVTELPPGATVTVPEDSLPEFGELEYEYDPATGEFTYTLTVDLADQLRAGTAAPQPQPLMRGMAFNALAAGDYEDSFVITVDPPDGEPYDVTVNVLIPTKHIAVDGEGIDAGITPVRVVYAGDYAYVMNLDPTPPNFAGTVRAIYIGELAPGQEQPAPVDIPVGNVPQWLETDGSHVYVSGQDGVTVIDTANNTKIAVLEVEGGRPYFLHPSGDRLYVGVIDAMNPNAPQRVTVLDISDPESTTYGDPIGDPIVIDGVPYGIQRVGDRLYVVTVKYVQDPETGVYAQLNRIVVFDVDDRTEVGSVALEKPTTTMWLDSTGRYLYVPGLNSGLSGPGDLYVYDTQAQAFVDHDPETAGVQHIVLGSLVTNVVFDGDNDIAYVGRYGDTLSVIDTRTGEEITTISVPVGTGQIQGLIVSGAPDGSVWVTDPFNNRLFVLRLVDGPLPAAETL